MLLYNVLVFFAKDFETSTRFVVGFSALVVVSFSVDSVVPFDCVSDVEFLTVFELENDVLSRTIIIHNNSKPINIIMFLFFIVTTA